MKELLLTESQTVRLNSSGLEGIIVALSLDEKTAFVQFNTAAVSVTELTPIENGTGATPDGLFCSFCNKGQSQVERLVAGQAAYICNACIAISVEVLLNPKPQISVPSRDDNPEQSIKPDEKKPPKKRSSGGKSKKRRTPTRREG